MAKSSKKEVPAKKKSGYGKYIALAILLIIAIAVYYLYSTYGSLPMAILSAKQLNASTLRSIMLAKVSSASMVNMTYSGSVTVNMSDPQIALYYNKSGGSTLVDFRITQENGTFSRVRVTFQNASLSGPGYVCTSSTANESFSCSNNSTPLVPLLNLGSQIAKLQTLDHISMGSYSLSSFDGQPCYMVQGTATVMANGRLFNTTGFVPAALNFTGCLSAQYNLPVEIYGKATRSNGQTIRFFIEQSNFQYVGRVG
ncbi:MAG: hypothetical protein KGH72_02965 [Candidatus Micrarchaeota archaeon]|nr:hypothetical protein [Candidatus Micrarchaeota archaeon]